MSMCCPNCFDDAVVQNFVRSHAQRRGRCAFCKSTRVPLTDAAAVGEFVWAGVDREYETCESAGLPIEMARYGSIGDVLYNEGLFADCIDDPTDLVNALLEGAPGGRAIDEGATNYAESSFVSNDFWHDDQQNAYQGAWDYFKGVVMHEYRFFDPPSPVHPGTLGWHRDTREEILQPVSELFPQLLRTLEPGTALWRARPAGPQMPSTPKEAQTALGPPPRDKAGHSRMNPAGIPYFYLGSDAVTCVAEVRPDVGAAVWLGEFVLRVPLRILDLTANVGYERKSIFDSSYDSKRIWAGAFMTAFSEEISRPMNADDYQLGYAPTQVLAEFIRLQGYHGLKFRSSQNPSGFNVVIFDGPSPERELHRQLSERFVLWVRLAAFHLHKMTGVSFTTSSKHSSTYTESDLPPDFEPSPF